MGIDYYAWLSLVVRWLHVITGIAWIGASFYFVWLDNHLEQPKDGDADGELWSVHGGGFYHNRKYMTAPAHMPEHLHWFKYEAYFTWISGFLLMAIIYYYGANLYLIDKSKMALANWQAIGLSLAMLISGWIVYDGLCKSPLKNKPLVFGFIILALLTGAAMFAGHVFSDRAAYIQIGAMIGTIMAGNVFFNIIPNQKIVVADLIAKRPVNPEFGKAAKMRSLHNNYFTLPVVFIMISTHYPMTFGAPIGWLSLLLVSLAGVFVRHVFNARAKHKPIAIYLGLATVFLIAAMTYPLALKPTQQSGSKEVRFSQVQSIINKHCTACHAESPTHESFEEAPLGFKLDTPERIRQNTARIYERAVKFKDMPLGNETGMTDDEREILRIWIDD
ncbi:MAG TPA: hypothetical protein ENJ42_04285 [Hellea balneolensis]|uniref:Urate oxidase N-terminal domain-containing protein n=1 Tax=Hellea balneolensis TaxID=287478 RepID=A0A7C5LT48_9PROT|nr:hypothetical protein [Hellea balneolensis]